MASCGTRSFGVLFREIKAPRWTTTLGKSLDEQSGIFAIPFNGDLALQLENLDRKALAGITEVQWDEIEKILVVHLLSVTVVRGLYRFYAEQILGLLKNSSIAEISDTLKLLRQEVATHYDEHIHNIEKVNYGTPLSHCHMLAILHGTHQEKRLADLFVEAHTPIYLGNAGDDSREYGTAVLSNQFAQVLLQLLNHHTTGLVQEVDTTAMRLHGTMEFASEMGIG